MSEFELDGERYSIGTMDVFVQADIAAKLAPLLPTFAEIARADGVTAELMAAKEEPDKGSKVLDILFKNLGPLTGVVAAMPTEDRHFIIQKCLGCVSRKPKDAVSWQPVWNVAAGQLQFADLNNLPTVLKICGHVISDKLSSFFPDAR